MVLILVAVVAVAVAVGSQTISFQLEQVSLIELASAPGAPAVQRDAAIAAGLQQLQDLNPDVHGLSLTAAHLSHGLRRIAGDGGRMLFTATDSLDAWVLEFAAPAQNGFRTVHGLVVVDARTGAVASAQLLQSN